MLTRPAEKVDVPSTTVPVRTRDSYTKQLVAARAGESPIPALRRVAGQYRTENGNWSPTQNIAYYPALRSFRSAVSGKAQASLADLNAAFTASFGTTKIADLVKDPAFEDNYQRLSDIVVTNTLLGEDSLVAASDASDLLTTMALISRLAGGDKSLEAPGAVTNALSRTLLLPPTIFPLLGRAPVVPDAPAAPGDSSGKFKVDAELADLLVKSKTLQTAYTALTRVNPEHLAMPAEQAVAATASTATPATAPTASRTPVGATATAATGAVGVLAPGRAISLNGSLANLAIGTTPMLLTAAAVKTFEPEEQDALTKLQVDPTKMSVTTAVDNISLELAQTESRIVELAGDSSVAMQRLGGAFYPAGSLAGLNFGAADKPTYLPSTHGSLTPAGIGDLLVVKQFLKRYEAYEESHIENILKGEYKEIVHTRTDVTETTITTEDEVDKEEDRDQQTTERFELQTETSNTVKDDSSLKAGVSVSGSYGPMVEFKATTDFAMSNSKEQSAKVGTNYSKEVVQKATSKLIEKHRQQIVNHYVTTVEEKNTHGFDNKGGSGPVIGQYQWVDKIYEAQVFNYGKRMLYDIMIPEPAAFLLYAASRPPQSQAALVKPDPFTLSPTDLTEWNYAGYVKKYGVAGVEPPPAPYVTSSKSVDGKGDDNSDGVASKTADVPVPDGYQAISASLITWFVYTDEDKAFVDLAFGSGSHQVKTHSGGGWYPTLNKETGTISLTALIFKINTFTTNVEITCQRAPATLDAWKLKTHTAILQAYQQLLRDYQDQLAALQMQAGQQVQGINPEENAKMIRNELKKGSISLFTNQQFDSFNAIKTSPQGFPEMNMTLANAEGSYIRFFEQAFEWEQMMYFFYPYYWGRKNNWIDRVMLQDVDPLFSDFIKAGSARCVVPVRPGFEQAIAYFLETGQIWNGGDLPTISDPLYVSIIEEIKERDQAPGDEIPQGDPWDVRLPTTLIYLRDKDSLPSWHKMADGTWVPD